MKHITKFTTESENFNGYRVHVQKKGITFCKYVSAKGGTWEEAYKEAVEIERHIAERLAACHTQDDVIKFYLEWRG